MTFLPEAEATQFDPSGRWSPTLLGGQEAGLLLDTTGLALPGPSPCPSSPASDVDKTVLGRGNHSPLLKRKVGSVLWDSANSTRVSKDPPSSHQVGETWVRSKWQLNRGGKGPGEERKAEGRRSGSRPNSTGVWTMDMMASCWGQRDKHWQQRRKNKQTKHHHVQALGLKDALDWTKKERSYKHFSFSCFIVSMVGFFVGLFVCVFCFFVCLLFGGEGDICSSSLASAITNQLGLLVWGASII